MDISNILKEEIQNNPSLVRIADLKNFASKNDLKNFATKDDLKDFATKDDLKNFATKDDIHLLSVRIDTLAKEVSSVLLHVNIIYDDVITRVRSVDTIVKDKKRTQ